VLHEPPWYGTVCPVVWEDGGSNPASYPIKRKNPFSIFFWHLPIKEGRRDRTSECYPFSPSHVSVIEILFNGVDQRVGIEFLPIGDLDRDLTGRAVTPMKHEFSM